MSARKKTIDAVHIVDLEPILDKYGMADAFRAGEVKCTVCGDTVMPDNAGSIKFTNGVPTLVCSKVPCYGKIVSAIMR